jgi:hypothetical protein
LVEKRNIEELTISHTLIVITKSHSPSGK